MSYDSKQLRSFNGGESIMSNDAAKAILYGYHPVGDYGQELVVGNQYRSFDNNTHGEIKVTTKVLSEEDTIKRVNEYIKEK
jgi:hypothetical protein